MSYRILFLMSLLVCFATYTWGQTSAWAELIMYKDGNEDTIQFSSGILRHHPQFECYTLELTATEPGTNRDIRVVVALEGITEFTFSPMPVACENLQSGIVNYSSTGYQFIPFLTLSGEWIRSQSEPSVIFGHFNYPASAGVSYSVVFGGIPIQ